MRTCLALAPALGLLMASATAATALAQDWKPAAGPLMTRWAKDVTPDKVHPEYPRPTMARQQWQNLNGLWDYAIVERAAARPETFQGKILVPFPVESALSGVMKTVGEANRLWYRRTFTVPAAWRGQRILLHFGAVDWEATVYVNGTEVGSHKGGYDGFSFDVTDAIKADAEQQEIVVAVWDPTDAGPQPRGKQVRRPGGIYYTPTTGIWQTVWIEPVPARAHIASVKVNADLESITVQARVDARIRAVVSTFVDVLDGDRVIASGPAGQPIKVPNPKLWTPDAPHLYTLRVRAALAADSPALDSVESYAGLRQVTVGKDDKGVTRLLLNGKFVFQMGFLDQGFWPDGLYTAPTDEALKYDIEVSKRLGMNMARKHVKVEPERWYYWCDRLGLLVWQDMPSGDRGAPGNTKSLDRTPESREIFERELKAMIDARHNHPSIVMWVVFNEAWGQYDTDRLTRWTKQYDPTRWVNCASGWHDFPVGDVVDMHNYPGPGAPKYSDTRAAVLGEFGGLGLPVQGHLWETTRRNWGYRVMSGPDALTRTYARLLAGVYRLKDEAGLCAAVYTQTTDVETEVNGLLTYDRAMIKGDADVLAKANRGEPVPVPQYADVIPTSQERPATWRYTTDNPGAGWHKPEFDASAWKEGPGGFGTRGTPGAVVGTVWNTPTIWIRREVTLPEDVDVAKLEIRMHHDEDAEVFLNGVSAARAAGYTTGYEEFDIAPAARATLKPGAKVLIAARCRQTQGGQFLDVGLVQLK